MYVCMYMCIYIYVCVCVYIYIILGFPGGTVDKNLPANAGNVGLILGPRRFHMPRHNY